MRFLAGRGTSAKEAIRRRKANSLSRFCPSLASLASTGHDAPSRVAALSMAAWRFSQDRLHRWQTCGPGGSAALRIFCSRREGHDTTQTRDRAVGCSARFPSYHVLILCEALKKPRTWKRSVETLPRQHDQKEKGTSRVVVGRYVHQEKGKQGPLQPGIEALAN